MELRKIDLNTTTLTLSIFGDLDAAGSRDAQTGIDDVISTREIFLLNQLPVLVTAHCLLSPMVKRRLII
ncbi:hypothetical protein AB4509_13760 [Vibrio echinoideorum]